MTGTGHRRAPAVAVVAAGVITGIFAGSLACSSQSLDPTQACEPGRMVACACPNGASGTQTCTSDGSGYGVCLCPGGGAGGSGVTGSGGGAQAGAGGVAGGTGGAVSSAPVGMQCPAGVKNRGVCSSEPACFNTCGPLKTGFRNCTCAAGMWSCAMCDYDPAGDYACFLLPAAVAACPVDATDPSGMGLPQPGGACALPSCQPCGSRTAAAYRDATSTPKIGFCVCTASDGTGTYSCAPVSEWPPQR